jgi:hypothetical protein
MYTICHKKLVCFIVGKSGCEAQTEQRPSHVIVAWNQGRIGGFQEVDYLPDQLNGKDRPRCEHSSIQREHSHHYSDSRSRTCSIWSGQVAMSPALLSLGNIT